MVGTITVTRADSGKLTGERSGVEPTACEVVAWETGAIAVKVPGHRYWVGVALDREWMPPEILVYEVRGVERIDDNRWQVEAATATPLLAVEVGRTRARPLKPPAQYVDLPVGERRQ